MSPGSIFIAVACYYLYSTSVGPEAEAEGANQPNGFLPARLVF